MEFVKEFATFLHQNGIIKFGDFTLASGKKSSYYVDLRLVPSYPIEFRKMVKYLENEIGQDIGLDNFDSIVSVPTGGLVIASALAIETVKPLIYVRSKPKDYGTSKSVDLYDVPAYQLLLRLSVIAPGALRPIQGKPANFSVQCGPLMWLIRKMILKKRVWKWNCWKI